MIRWLNWLICNTRLWFQVLLLAGIGGAGLLGLAIFVTISDISIVGLQVETDRAGWAYDKIVAIDRGLLLAQRAEAEALDRGEARAVETHHAVLRAVDANMRLLTGELGKYTDAESRALLADIVALQAPTANYATAFTEAVAHHGDIAAARTSLQQDIAVLLTQLAAIKAQALDMRGEATTTLAETRTASRGRILWATGGVLLLTMTVAGALGIGLTRALRRVVQNMRRLSAGDGAFDLATTVHRPLDPRPVHVSLPRAET